MTTGTLRTFIAAACRHLPLGAPGGLLPRRAYLSLVLAVSVLSPVVVLRGFVFHPLERIVSPRPAPNDRYGDPLVALGVLGRTWIRWDDGDFSRNDDRVFAPYPNVWAIAESSTALAAVGYPFYRLTGSFTFGYNAAYFLSCVLTALGAGLAFRMLAGPGWPALFGTILFLWCPGRLNNLGAIQTLWAGLNLFPLAFLLRFARSPSWRNASLGAASFTAVCLGSLYGGLMGAVLLALVAPVVLLALSTDGGAWISPRARRDRLRRLPRVVPRSALRPWPGLRHPGLPPDVPGTRRRRPVALPPRCLLRTSPPALRQGRSRPPRGILCSLPDRVSLRRRIRQPAVAQAGLRGAARRERFRRGAPHSGSPWLLSSSPSRWARR